MNRPSALVRFVGQPRNALLAFLLCAALVWGWFDAGVPWWLALFALGGAQRSLTAYGELKRYNAWRAEWDAMAPPEDRPAPAPRAQFAAPHINVGGRVLVGVAALIAIAIPFSGAGSSDALICVWFGACVFLAWKLIRMMRRKGGSGAAISRRGKTEAAEDGTVAWLLPPASSSPSPMEAMRNLPEYSARLIGR